MSSHQKVKKSSSASLPVGDGVPDVPTHFFITPTQHDSANMPAMMIESLPGLKTQRQVHQAAATQTVAQTPAPVAPAIPSTPAKSALPGLDHPKLNAITRAFLQELVNSGLMPAADVPRFLRALDDRVANITTKVRAADALVQLGFLTDYQSTRALNGQYFGTVFGPYRVMDKLGSGTVGTVFLGEHTFLKRSVAIKVMAGEGNDDPQLLERFVQEAQTLAALNHPHVVAALDAGFLTSDVESQWYLVLEPVLGGDLEQFIYNNGTQPIDQVARWGWQAAQGLHAAHEAGLIHRDVKPSNCLLSESLQIKISDFGLVRRYDTTQTPQKSVIGSLEFMAPEQLNDPTTVTFAADTYSLGATLFWCLTGKLPYPENLRTGELVDYLLNKDPITLKTLNPDLPDDLSTTIGKMLARNPGERPSLTAVAAFLSKYASPGVLTEVAKHLPNPDNFSTTESLRFAISTLESKLTEKESKVGAMRDAVLVALRTSVILRPGETRGHLQRVASYARFLAKRLSQLPNWSGYRGTESVNELARAATLHDLGLVGISDSIETGAVSRTPSEEHEYRTHPVVGAQMLDYLGERHGRDLPYLRSLRDVVKHHHERWDGTGWPDALKGTAIPASARIVAVADAYDRLRAPSGEKRGMAHEDAMTAISREAGTKFDPEVIEAFKSLAAQFADVFGTVAEDPTTAPLTAAQQATANIVTPRTVGK